MASITADVNMLTAWVGNYEIFLQTLSNNLEASSWFSILMTLLTIMYECNIRSLIWRSYGTYKLLLLISSQVSNSRVWAY